MDLENQDTLGHLIGSNFQGGHITLSTTVWIIVTLYHVCGNNIHWNAWILSTNGTNKIAIT